jgi:YD repeat-containing protein
MKTNILGTEETLNLYNKEGGKVYEFDTDYPDPNKWDETTYDKNGRVLTFINKYGFCVKYTRDSYGNELTYENSDGERRGFDLPEFTREQLIKKVIQELGNFKLIK